MPLGTQVRSSARRNGRAPRCDHIDGLPAPEPENRQCAACLAAGRSWPRLLVCLSCGWVACPADSRAHYRETDHPVAASLAPGETWRWCHVHRRVV
ncbi:UBP-type zinc finger domain-containing protein [Nonomuraea sp. NPDC049419]|uniref:UBP-type zinc finger domain-containing protein n=1 Tax=Nonomuraea sp. NPDC049419 TaxID=3155772 RepID=UPI00343F7C98